MMSLDVARLTGRSGAIRSAALQSSKRRARARAGTVAHTTWTWWTDNVLLRIGENYASLDGPVPRRFIDSAPECQFFYCRDQEVFFYVPRR